MHVRMKTARPAALCSWTVFSRPGTGWLAIVLLLVDTRWSMGLGDRNRWLEKTANDAEAEGVGLSFFCAGPRKPLRCSTLS